MNSNEDGMTTIETVISLMIIATVGALLSVAILTSLSSVDKTKSTSSSTENILVSDYMLRQYALDVRIPWWERNITITSSANYISLPWYRGIRNDTVEFSVLDDVLRITTTIGQSQSQFTVLSKMKNINITLIRAENHTAQGILVSWGSHRGINHADLPFGSCVTRIDNE